VTERVHPGGVARVPAEVPEEADLVVEEWVAQGRGQVREENAPVLNVERVSLMRSACPVITGNAQNAAQKWSENNSAWVGTGKG
jgi:hypothetical protein